MGKGIGCGVVLWLTNYLAKTTKKRRSVGDKDPTENVLGVVLLVCARALTRRTPS